MRLQPGCKFDLFKDHPSGPARATWPRRNDLHTQNIWLGSIIERCWTKGAFQDARSPLTALDLVTLDDALEHERKIYQHLKFNNNLRLVLAVAIGCLTFLLLR